MGAYVPVKHFAASGLFRVHGVCEGVVCSEPRRHLSLAAQGRVFPLRPESGFRSGSAPRFPQTPLRKTAALMPPRMRACPLD